MGGHLQPPKSILRRVMGAKWVCGTVAQLYHKWSRRASMMDATQAPVNGFGCKSTGSQNLTDHDHNIEPDASSPMRPEYGVLSNCS